MYSARTTTLTTANPRSAPTSGALPPRVLPSQTSYRRAVRAAGRRRTRTWTRTRAPSISSLEDQNTHMPTREIDPSTYGRRTHARRLRTTRPVVPRYVHTYVRHRTYSSRARDRNRIEGGGTRRDGAGRGVYPTFGSGDDGDGDGGRCEGVCDIEGVCDMTICTFRWVGPHTGDKTRDGRG
ncbi:hypothetical protein FKP32DRAFT_1148990 [Trametes sanguinea]|nr:hypothetical protein FKP32DRAFT_1148990 [Trametes sanguinea]